MRGFIYKFNTLQHFTADEAFSVAAWPVERSGFFSKFRIYQTGKNSNNNNHLMCAGIELYGQLRTDDDEVV